MAYMHGYVHVYTQYAFLIVCFCGILWTHSCWAQVQITILIEMRMHHYCSLWGQIGSPLKLELFLQALSFSLVGVLVRWSWFNIWPWACCLSCWVSLLTQGALNLACEHPISDSLIPHLPTRNLGRVRNNLVFSMDRGCHDVDGPMKTHHAETYGHGNAKCIGNH